MALEPRSRSTAPQAGTSAAESPGLLRCAADPDTIRAWLHSPAADDPTITVAERLDIDEAFSVDDIDFSHRADALLREGQEAGVFGIPGHRIHLVDVADKVTQQVATHLLLIERPDGTRHASDYIDADDLADAGQYGIDAAVSLYDTLADHTNGVVLQAELSARANATDQQQATNGAAPAAGSPARLAASSFGTTATRAAASSPAAGPTTAETAAAVARVSGSTSPRRSR